MNRQKLSFPASRHPGAITAGLGRQWVRDCVPARGPGAAEAPGAQHRAGVGEPPAYMEVGALILNMERTLRITVAEAVQSSRRAAASDGSAPLTRQAL